MSGSWAHSLHPPDTWAQYEVGTARVPVEAMADVLEEARALGGPLVVKVNTEGEECAIVLETPAEAWTAVERGLRRDARVGTLRRRGARGAPRAGRLQAASGRDGAGACGCVAKQLLDPTHVPIPRELPLHRRSRARAESPRVELVAQHIGERALESRLVARRDEPAVLAVDEPVARLDRLRARDDDRLRERHRLEQHRRRAGVAVLPDRQRDDAGLGEPPPHLVERDLGLDVDVLGYRRKAATMLAARDDPEADVGQALGDAQEQREVTMRVGAHRHDVNRHLVALSHRCRTLWARRPPRPRRRGRTRLAA